MAWTRRLLAKLAVGAASIALLLAPAVPATASVDAPEGQGLAARSGDTSDFEFRSFDAVYLLQRGSDRRARLDVTETAVAVFPAIDQNRGIIRSIPNYYGDVNLDTTVLGVEDENGDPVYYEVQDDGGFTIVIIDDDTFKHGATTYVIHYSQSDTIRSFGSGDEFYWDVNGTGWDQPFGEVSARVVVEPAIVDALAEGESCYQGPENATTPCSGGISRSVDPAGAAVYDASAQNLGPRENLTVVVPFVSGTFVEGTPDPNGSPYDPGSPYEPEPPFDLGEPPGWAIAVSMLAGAISFVTAIVGAVVLRRRRATPTGFIIPQYSVPKNLDIMVAAELIQRGSTAIQAQLVSLAVKRKIRLLGYAVTDADGADYAVQLLDPTGLESWEQAVVDALFGPGAEPGAARDLQRSGDSELADALRPIVAQLPGAVTASGFIGPSARVRGTGWVLLAVAVLGAVSLIGAIFSGWVGVVLGMFGFIFILIALGVAGFAARKQPTLSAHGAETVDYLLGMQMYLTLAEKDRFAVLQSATGADRIDIGDGKQLIKLYEKLLPWAVVWGVEESWARELEIQLAQTGEELDWYAGTAPFHAYQFASLLSGVHTGTSAPVTTSGSSWSGSGFSSFSSGSFGGGFSGGGGGGGGGGGR